MLVTSFTSYLVEESSKGNIIYWINSYGGVIDYLEYSLSIPYIVAKLIWVVNEGVEIYNFSNNNDDLQFENIPTCTNKWSIHHNYAEVLGCKIMAIQFVGDLHIVYEKSNIGSNECCPILDFEKIYWFQFFEY